MANQPGEMPFLDHLEELRKRILLAVVGMTVGIGIGWVVTRQFKLIQVIERPISPYVPGGKLMVTTLIAPFMLNFKLAVVLGLVLASPWVLYQLWLFLSPALTGREKKAILPALGIGLLLFLAGALVGWIYVVPPMVKWFIQFDLGSFNTQITYESYIQLVMHLLLAMGASAEIPLVMILLALLGVVSYPVYKRFRRFAIFLSFVGGAILSPTPEVSMMLIFTVPLLLLYEIGVAGSYVVERRRLRAARALVAGIVFVVLALNPVRLHAQFPPPVAQGPPGSQGVRPPVTGQGVRAIDSSTARRLGLPAAPTRLFPSPDLVMQDLLDREGFAATRFLADSAVYVVTSQTIVLGGHAATDRSGSQLEADQIVYDDAHCQVEATGEPRMFDHGQARVGRTMRFNTCTERGVIDEAFTSLAQQGANWFVRGNLAVDSSGKRVYAAKGEFTSCDLPDPHYHFTTGQIKWTGSTIVARPAVLYIRDVPIAWLPFIFQDTKRDRSSGILIPRFGFNDIIRTTRNYNRTISNIGYYWAPNDYIGATGRFDWFSNRYVMYGADLEYHWLNRFVQGGIHLSEQVETSGATNRILSWQHQQSFDVTTTLTFNLNYASNSTVLQNNSVDPLLSTQQITSQLSLSKRYRWGSVTVGGSRNQSLSDGSGTMNLPTLSVAPRPVALGRNITWSPSVSVTNAVNFSTPQSPLPVLAFGGLDTVTATSHSRNTTMTVNTPIDFFGLTWQNAVQYQDQNFTGRRVITQRVPDLSTPELDDSITTSTIRSGDYSTGIDWTTSLALPLLLRGTWKVTPSVGVTNVTTGPFVLRTPGSNGQFVVQGKKVQLQLQAAPTFFGFIDRGLGPYQRFRYTFAPLITIQYSPSASVSQSYAKALGAVGGQSLVDIPTTTLGTISFHQAFEAKLRKAPGDTNTDPIHLASLPKKQLLSISTSQIGYDFEQAKLPGRTGWTTQVLTNSFQSDLLQGFQLSMTHDLWQGQVGTDTAKFSPFLSNLQASVAITGRTFHSIAALFGLTRRDTTTLLPPAPGMLSPLGAAQAMSFGQQRTPYGPPPPRGFNMTLSYSLSRQRPIGPTGQPVTTEPSTPGSTLDPFGNNTIFPIIQPPAQSSLGLTMSFSPTAFWSVSWNTQYDFAAHAFQSQQIQLERDLHDWRARFTFSKAPNGNFALYFSVFLMTLPDIKFDYNQTTLQQTPIQP